MQGASVVPLLKPPSTIQDPLETTVTVDTGLAVVAWAVALASTGVVSKTPQKDTEAHIPLTEPPNTATKLAEPVKVELLKVQIWVVSVEVRATLEVSGIPAYLIEVIVDASLPQMATRTEWAQDPRTWPQVTLAADTKAD